MTTPTSTSSPQPTDASGFRVFSSGDAGEIHVLAHRMLDEGRMEDGHRVLGAWLEERRGSGREWIHLQWHMAVFEIAVGRIEEAFERFHREILPAVPTGEALTDAPSLLWRLSLATGESLDIDWRPVGEAAQARLATSDDPYIELHNLLALAGAEDLELLTQWLDVKMQEEDDSESREVLLRLGWGLRTWATGDYEVAAAILTGCVESVSRIGGSRAQNELFDELAREAARRGQTPLAA